MNKEEMKHYIITKTVKAMPMKYIEANSNGAIPEMNECLYNVNPDGYYVENDGRRYWVNHVSFEEDYKVAETFLDKLRIEYADVKERLDNLEEFFKPGFDEVAKKIGARQAALLTYQIFVMKTYVEVLDVRIDDIEQSIKNGK
jgi:hypothetical protein